MAADRAASSVKDKWNGLSDKQRTAIKVGAAVAATALVAYGAYKIDNKIFTDKLGHANSIIDEGRQTVARVYDNTMRYSKEANENIKWAGYDLRAERPGTENWNKIQEARGRLRDRTKSEFNSRGTYIGNDGRWHEVSGYVNMLTGEHKYSNPTGFDRLDRISTRKELKEWERNFRRGQEKMLISNNKKK
jgi:hypothetical protein